MKNTTYSPCRGPCCSFGMNQKEQVFFKHMYRLFFLLPLQSFINYLTLVKRSCRSIRHIFCHMDHPILTETCPSNAQPLHVQNVLVLRHQPLITQKPTTPACILSFSPLAMICAIQLSAAWSLIWYRQGSMQLWDSSIHKRKLQTPNNSICLACGYMTPIQVGESQF